MIAFRNLPKKKNVNLSSISTESRSLIKHQKLCKKASFVGNIKKKMESKTLVVGNRESKDRFSNILKM